MPRVLVVEHASFASLSAHVSRCFQTPSRSGSTASVRKCSCVQHDQHITDTHGAAMVENSPEGGCCSVSAWLKRWQRGGVNR